MTNLEERFYNAMITAARQFASTSNKKHKNIKVKSFKHESELNDFLETRGIIYLDLKISSYLGEVIYILIYEEICTEL